MCSSEKAEKEINEILKKHKEMMKEARKQLQLIAKKHPNCFFMIRKHDIDEIVIDIFDEKDIMEIIKGEKNETS